MDANAPENIGAKSESGVMSWMRVAAVLGSAFGLLGTASVPVEASEDAPLTLAAPGKQWVGDLDGMLERRMVRVLVVSSKTLYFYDNGTPRGASYDVFRAFEDELNRNLQAGHRRVHVVFIPVARDELLRALVDGRGDIAAANLTITPERQRVVDFADPIFSGVSELVITGPTSPQIATLDDLSGREVFVRKSSSYHASLLALNDRFRAEGRAEVQITPVPEILEDEDLLEMLNAGLIGVTVVDSYKAEFWAQVFPDIVLHPDIALRTEADIGWAIRKGSPKLRAQLDAFGTSWKTGTAFGNEIFNRYFRSVKYVKSGAPETELKRLLAFFRKYGEDYGLDWMLLAAQGYQESRFDHGARSRDGAIGVMQVMPATGRELEVGDIRLLEPNINAGVKYVRRIIDNYLKDEPMDSVNRMLFAFASYNAGPARIKRLRSDAEKRGLDPNVWFDNVELIAAEKIGRETVAYVSNIFKYYIGYRLTYRQHVERRAAKSELVDTLSRRATRSLNPDSITLLAFSPG